MAVKIIVGDCRVHMAAMEPDSISAVVTDPPYELGFMGKGWDRSGVAFEVETWRAAFRVLKPGGHLLAFGGPRTEHRMACAIEDAGFEIRDKICWLFGSGFPKSLDVSKAIDKAAGAEREIVGSKIGIPGYSLANGGEAEWGGLRGSPEGEVAITAPATPAAEQWAGYGTALKPAYEGIIVARKPFRGNVAANVLTHGTGAINVDGCRISFDGERVNLDAKQRRNNIGGGGYQPGISNRTIETDIQTYKESGRWPANVVLDEDAAAMLDEQSGESQSTSQVRHNGAYKSVAKGAETPRDSFGFNDTGGASRFFYTAKASRSERNKGLDGMPTVPTHRYGAGIGEGIDPSAPSMDTNHHPTVKPVDLMQWLVRLVTPPGGIVLDPFMGSGSTCIAADREGFNCIGIEISPEYVEIARRRIVGDCPMFAEVLT